MLEPVLSFCLVASLYWLGPSRGRQLLSGALIGLAAATKLWMLPVALFLLVVVWRRHGRSAALTWAGAATAVVVVLVLPALLMAPSGFVDQVFTYQLGRARLWSGWGFRLQFFNYFGGPPPVGELLGQRGLAALAIAVLAFSMLALKSAPGRVWALLTLVTIGVVLAGPLFFDHYAAFAAAPEAIALGFAVTEVGALSRHLRLVLPLGLVACGVVALLGLRQASLASDFPADEVRARVGIEQCVWTRVASTAIAIDRETSPCASTLDDYSRVLATGGGTGTLDEFRMSPAYQEQTVADFGRASVAVVVPGDRDRWTQQTVAAFEARFPVVEWADGIEVRKQG
jgi:hypothetical protein